MCQIFWKGDPGIENFSIKFLTDDMMQKWYKELNKQKDSWTGSRNNTNSRSLTSTTEFISLQGSSQLENPYKQDDEDDEEVDLNSILNNESYNSSHPTLAEFASGWNQSQTSLRARSTTIESNSVPPSRTAPPRLPPGSLQNPGPGLSIRTQHLQSSSFSPAGDRYAESYFSPVEESPMSTRTSTSSGMYPTPRQGHFSEGGYANHVPYRSTSREQMNQQGYPSAARQAGRPSHQASASAPSNGPATTRNRSISSPSINDAQRRVTDSNRPPMPDGIPAHIQRAHTNSPHLGSGGIDERVAMMSPAMRFANSPSMNGPATPRISTPMQYQRELMSPGLGSQTPNPDMPTPSQLKVKVHASAAGQVLTLVVPGNITYQSLKDRIDAKLQRSTNISLTDRGAGNTVKLKYLDEDDYVNIASDEDVQIAFETWREQRGDGMGMGEIELFCM